MNIEKVYILRDRQDGVIIGDECYISEYSARCALVDWLQKQYSPGEWLEFAEDNGYDNPAEFTEAVQKYADYDDDLEVEVQEMKIV